MKAFFGNVRDADLRCLHFQTWNLIIIAVNCLDFNYLLSVTIADLALLFMDCY